jgi:hypothetical protein
LNIFVVHKFFQTFIFTNIIFNLNTLKAMGSAWWKFISKMPPLLPNMLAFVLIKAAKQSYWWMVVAAHREISLIFSPIIDYLCKFPCCVNSSLFGFLTRANFKSTISMRKNQFFKIHTYCFLMGQVVISRNQMILNTLLLTSRLLKIYLEPWF